mmetsp:Transcript_1753/g.2626  ORF Transcript_1753/g.2626 Transcript_1753/m.2626 type:complete len:205 (-) Transcript_1753:7-621(-)
MSPEAVTSPAPNSTGGSGGVEFEPPLACVRRLLKGALPKSTNVGKDASTAFTRACGIFVIYLTTCANDFARENRRQTITANDVLAAVKELDFDEFTPQLEAFLEQHRSEERSKKDAKKAAAAKMAKEQEQEEKSTDDMPDAKPTNDSADVSEVQQEENEPISKAREAPDNDDDDDEEDEDDHGEAGGDDMEGQFSDAGTEDMEE